MLAIAPLCGRWRSGMISWREKPPFFFFPLLLLLLLQPLPASLIRTDTLGIERWARAPFIVERGSQMEAFKNAKRRKKKKKRKDIPQCSRE